MANKQVRKASTFDSEFLQLLNSHLAFGYKTKKEMIETALFEYKNNYDKNVLQDMFLTILKNQMLDNMKSLEKLSIVNVKNLLILDYLFTEIFYKANEKEDTQLSPEQIKLEIEKGRLYADNKLKELIEDTIGGE